jgi:diacylglycerol kinase family enzyme
MDADRLIGLVRDAGHQPIYLAAKDNNLAAALREPADVVVAAGGDGTVTKVMQMLPDGATMTVVPLGTANNIANSLGLIGGAQDIIRRWNEFAARPFDLWTVIAGEHHHVILEACGLGIIAATAAELHAMGEDDSVAPGDKLAAARGRLRAVAARQPAIHVRLRCDGCRLEGDYILLEFLNVALVGPRLPLLAGADWSDGLLDLLFLQADDRTAFCNWLDSGTPQPWAAAPALQFGRIDIEFEHGVARFGDNIFWPPHGATAVGGPHKIALRAAERGVKILAPATSGRH